MLRLLASLALTLFAAAVLAGQVCTIDPPRPVGNTGTGFYVSNAAPGASAPVVLAPASAVAIKAFPASSPAPLSQWKLYDPTGTEFVPRGVNRSHFDSWGSDDGIRMTGANTERTAPYFSRNAAQNLADLKKITDAGIVPIPGMWSGTCKADVASLVGIVDTWVAQAATWTSLNNTGLINIANEWGPKNSPVWRDAYIDAIARMRAAGYTGTLVVDSGECGQDAYDVINYGAAVLAADPQHNVLFDIHVYGGFSLPATVAWQNDYAKAMAALKATGLPIMLGEFGPGAFTTADGVVHKFGPSPTAISPAQVIATAEANGWGWLAWAWDDNNLGGCMSSDVGWFALSNHCGVYTGNDATELTAFGRFIVPMFRQTGAKKALLH